MLARALSDRPTWRASELQRVLREQRPYPILRAQYSPPPELGYSGARSPKDADRFWYEARWELQDVVLIWVVIGLALLGAIHLGLGGRAILGTRERPERIPGRRAQLSLVEGGPRGLDPEQSAPPPATIGSFSPEDGYRLRFDAPFPWVGRVETEAHVFARHVGYPVSSAASRWRASVWVNGQFGSGERFISAFRLRSPSGARPSNDRLERTGAAR